MSDLKGYKLAISKATGVTDPEELARIEDCMRQDIFHSTLDWQTARQFDRGAREAVELLAALDEHKRRVNWLMQKNSELTRMMAEAIIDAEER